MSATHETELVDHEPLQRGRVGRFRPSRIVHGAVSVLLAVAALAGLAVGGQRLGWKMPKFSELTGASARAKDDWCEEHAVPDSICVECRPELLPKTKEFGWCRKHGVHECPLCHPEVAQLPGPAYVTAADRARAEEALAFYPRPSNGHSCSQQQRRIQFASQEVFDQLQIGTAPVTRGKVVEAITATGELDLDPTKVARVSSRVHGTIRALLQPVGRHVRAGEIVAIVDAAEVGKTKGELLQALASLELCEQTLAGLKESAGKTVKEQDVLNAEASRAEAEVRVLAAQQSLNNLGLQVDPQALRKLPAEEAGRQLRFLGIPESLASALSSGTDSNNLLPVRSPLDGEIIERPAAEGDAAGSDRVLVVVADSRQMWLTLQVRLEDAARIRPRQLVRFQHEGHDTADTGTVAWISPAADEKSRTVLVRVAWPNENGAHHAHTFGTAQVILRDVQDAIVVPNSAIHWEGCCYVVFVRDKYFETSPYKVFHVRKVRLGASDPGLNGDVTEVAVGVLPGEVIATTNSGILRSELLKNGLGAG